MLIAMAGLPATGKSTIARSLAARLNAVLLDKDEIRAALFLPEDIEYTTQQNDFCLDIMFQVGEYLLKKDPMRHIILDGRPFSRRYQVERLVAFAAQIKTPLKIIECTVSNEDARRRLENAQSQGNHLAANRNYELFLRLKSQAEEIDQPKLVINTGEIDLAASIEKAIAYIMAG
jgi:predicted kinase